MSIEEFNIAVEESADRWVPACGGTENPFMMKGRRLLYVFNPATSDHAYLDLDTDLILDEDEISILFLH